MTVKNPSDCQSIEEVRNELDRIDKQLIALFSERHKYIEKIVEFKDDEEGIVAINRKDEVIEQRAVWAAKQGLNGETFKKIYTLLVDSNIKRELEIFASKKEGIQP